MAYTIPCSPELTHYDMQVPLDGTVYTMEFRWNTRSQAWFMHVCTEQGEHIISSVRVVIDAPLGVRSLDARKPKGVFFAVDTSGSRRDPGITDLGDRVQLIYFSAAELPLTV
jgi:hypothetical protein